VRLRIRDLRKAFDATVALASVDLDVEPGEVHAVLGENGAGKSTLNNILAGAIARDGGTIALDDQIYAPRTPREARDLGVAIVHQELSLCLHLTVEENVLLGVEPHRGGIVDRKRSRELVVAALERIGANVSPDDRVSELSPAKQQLVEIARTIAIGLPRVLILDEPTSSLGASDAEKLFALVSELRTAGVSILYVSHFLEEVQRLCDRYTVLRDGTTVGSGAVKDIQLDALIAQMAGRTVDRIFQRSERTPGAPILEVNGVRDASFVLHRGEVLGIAGLVGAGRTELLRAIFGLDRVRKGDIRVGAWVGPGDPHASLEHGIGLLSEDRKHEGLALNRSVAENIALSALPLIVHDRDLRAAADTRVAQLGIRVHDVDAPVSRLSGGNQQKVALARLLHHDCDVFLLDEPTRGIDVRSKGEIYGQIDALATKGKAVLVVSSWLPELLGLCDRIAVMRRGTLGQARRTEDWSEEKLLKEALNVGAA
jgi:ribose transport system ATP-binding protein